VYSPQLGTRLKISHTQLNIVALAANVGVYITGPVWGRIVDSRGPRMLLACSAVFLLGGYSGIRYLYVSGLAPDALSIPTISFFVLLLCGFLTGAGSGGGFAGSVNSTAKTFPDRARASTTGLVISGYGLSAFLFSTISHIFFAGRASPLLLFLALGSSFPMMLGSFFVRPIPLPEQEDTVGNHEGYSETSTSASAYEQHNNSRTRLLNHAHVEGNLQDDDHVALSPSHSPVSDSHRRSLSRGTALALDMLPNLHGKKLWCSSDFWLLFVILSILSGTGLMYINNVGSMSQCLYAYNNPNYDEVVASGWQVRQVSTISIMNFSGRVSIGLVSDFARNKYNMPRSYCLVLVSVMFFVSQVVVSSVNDITHLWIASALLGLSYGSVFSLFPTVCLEWFGMPHFSENWGFLALSPIGAGNLFSLAFGRNLDAHDSPPPHHTLNPPLTDVYSTPRCLQGLSCYVDTIYLTMFATFFGYSSEHLGWI